MKKELLLSILFLFPLSANALDNSTVANLHTNEVYVLNLDSRPKNISISNQRIIKTEPVTNIFKEDSYLIVRTFEEGISYITFKLKDGEKTIKVLVDDKACEDNNFFKLDKIEELP